MTHSQLRKRQSAKALSLYASGKITCEEYGLFQLGNAYIQHGILRTFEYNRRDGWFARERALT